MLDDKTRTISKTRIFVITGEDVLTGQTAGKVLVGVAKLAKKYGGKK